jgi:hypothetical protein
MDDPYFVDHDREKIIQINRQINLHHVPGALFTHYVIYGEGAPFERLFFQARDQLMEAIKLLANERAQRAYEKEFDEYDDFNFIDRYLELRSENSRLNEKLSQARSHLDYF